MVASFTDAWIETFFEVSALMFFVVASFTDAWIETPGGIAKKLLRQSHLLQMRGLKHRCWTSYQYHKYSVASFTDAWIETCRHVRLLSLSRVASFTDAWIETSSLREF